jgi:hypothetical protein
MNSRRMPYTPLDSGNGRDEKVVETRQSLLFRHGHSPLQTLPNFNKSSLNLLKNILLPPNMSVHYVQALCATANCIGIHSN